MLCDRARNRNIRWIIVCFVVVYVVDLLTLHECAPKDLFGHQAVLIGIPTNIG